MMILKTDYQTFVGCYNTIVDKGVSPEQIVNQQRKHKSF